MKINRHNYEEYFILYADNELSSEDRRMVEEFTAQHPDLKDELDGFLNTVLLPATSVGFNNKEELLRYDESLMLYVDDELSNTEKSELEKIISASPALQKELELYQKTKLQPHTEIVFENKSVLYRNAERKVVRMTWIRWAVAAVLLLAVSFSAIRIFSPGKKTEVAHIEDQSGNKENIAGATNTKDKKDTPDNLNEQPKQEILSQPEPSGLAVNNEKKELGTDKKQIQYLKEDKTKTANASANKKETNNLPKPENDRSVIIANTGDEFIAEVNPKPKRIEAVTISGNKTYNIQSEANVDAGKITQASFTDNKTIIIDEEEENSNKKSRGLFRKLTRVFEKNTGIKATDDEDRLHIAAFTVKLK